MSALDPVVSVRSSGPREDEQLNDSKVDVAGWGGLR
jgi:hypothetical protein